MSQHGGSSRDRWLVSYADFITLLFAFFVVMYSISSLNEGKFKILSETLQKTFQDPLKGLEPLQPGALEKFMSNFGREKDYEPTIQIKGEPDAKRQLAGDLTLAEIESQMRERFKGLVDDQLISFNQTKDWLEIEINSKMFFLPGTSALIRESESIVGDIAKILKRIPNPVTVEGFTDNIPISNELYPSNWELSTDRANSVLRALVAFGVQSERLSARGFGDNFPIADNETANGREENRRVVILVETLNNSRWDHLQKVQFKNKTTQKKETVKPPPIFPVKPLTVKPVEEVQPKGQDTESSLGGSNPDQNNEDES